MSIAAKSTQTQRTPVNGSCPDCGKSALERYEVLSTGGWFQVVKCQACLASLERTPWKRLGYVNRDHADAVINSEQGAAE
jgi:uncharacterized Zn finger protein